MIPVDAAILLLLILATPVVAAVLLVSWTFHRLARRCGRIPPDLRSWVEKPWVVGPAAGFLALYALCFAYGLFIEAHWVQTTRTEIPVRRPVLGRKRFRIVHLSDLHLERFGARERRAVEQIRAAQPHLILLTGDYLNRREGAAALHEFLSSIDAPFGVYGVEGNWDGKFVTGEIFRRAGARLLVDETELLRGGGGTLRLAGHSVHPRRRLGELLEGLEPAGFTIYLHHKPDAVDELEARGPGRPVDLFLCGHTHGGQVCLPFWGAVVTLSKYHKRYERGLYEVDGVPMYVNRGLGMEGGAAPRVRFLSRPEVAVIDLVAP